MVNSGRSSRRENLKQPMNNGKRRRQLKRDEKVLGLKLSFNEDITRAQLRRMANEPVNCKDCGERLLLKNMSAHVHKAMLHVKGKRKKGG
jgi:DNA-directed RNA polymerase subunit RPC12/RpoP